LAAPFVSGLAALVWSTSYGTSNTSVRSRIENTADPVPGTGNYWYYGRINAQHAVGVGVPQVSTGQASDITPESAVLHGDLVSLDSMSSVQVSFEYGDSDTGYTNSTESKTMSHGGEFYITVNGLSPDKVYYFRAKALDNY
jgi:hypothetical protein